MTDVQLDPRDQSWQEILDADIAAAMSNTWQGFSGRPGDQTLWTLTVSGDGPTALYNLVVVPPNGIPHVVGLRPKPVSAVTQ